MPGVEDGEVSATTREEGCAVDEDEEVKQEEERERVCHAQLTRCSDKAVASCNRVNCHPTLVSPIPPIHDDAVPPQL